MTTILLRDLAPGDTAALLDFENRNRGWFESTIEPRSPGFYSAAGVAHHIHEYLLGQQAGLQHPCLIVDADDVILGRANLKDIDRQAGQAEVGYRIGKDAVGRGCASAAVAHLVTLARARWGLRVLVAFVADGNPASARVLEKNGFRRAERHACLAVIRGEPCGGYAWRLDLAT
ncbi:MAG TPA: GNAT family N-acetyltransferase [Telluria sp.]|nr:GNAT family N-acetyltransferase [Telluria sp.]